MAENHCPGIYKKPSDKHLFMLYQNVRQALAKNDLKNAQIILQTAIDYGNDCSLVSDVQTLKCIQNEINLYEEVEQLKKGNNSSLSEEKNFQFSQIVNRAVMLWCEEWTQFPQSVFYLRTRVNNDRQPPAIFVGRKRLSNLFVVGKIPELHCSQVRPSMLLGLLHHTHASESKLRIYYYPLEFGEKCWLFNFVAQNSCQHDTEILYPFCLLHPSTHKELRSESDGWLLTEEMATELNEGETHLRDYSVQMLLKKIHKPYVLYDPACSTGQFLATLKLYFPEAHTIGQDLSESMVRFAREKNNVDEAVHANAFQWPLNGRQVDVAFIRFLNSEVVPTDMAHDLFDNIVTRVKPNGTIVVFGHTPVLLASSDFLSRSFLNLEKSVGAIRDDIGTVLFQYYVLKVH